MDKAMNLYCYWDGSPMSDNRKKCFNTLKNSKLDVHLITPQNLEDYLGESPHSKFKDLSPNHQSDYIRCHMLHFYGGGYSDIKNTSESWLPFVEEFEMKPYIWGMGYKEVPNGWARIKGDPDLSAKLKNNTDKLIGNGAFIFKAKTEFTYKWYERMLLKMEEPNLEWSELQGQVFHPLCLEYHERILNTLPMPSMKEYR